MGCPPAGAAACPIPAGLHLSGALINLHPEWFSADGFHPNGKGYAVIAGLFEAAYRHQA